MSEVRWGRLVTGQADRQGAWRRWRERGSERRQRPDAGAWDDHVMHEFAAGESERESE